MIDKQIHRLTLLSEWLISRENASKDINSSNIKQLTFIVHLKTEEYIFFSGGSGAFINIKHSIAWINFKRFKSQKVFYFNHHNKKNVRQRMERYLEKFQVFGN